MDLENTYFEYHLIARYYHWSRAEIKALPANERRLWASKIIEHEKAIHGEKPDDSV